jgi:hypothetical protein
MTAPEDGGQAERRTASGDGVSQPLNLIHRNNSPKPVSMRVSGRFAPRLLRPIRRVLYLPVAAIPYLPGGPLRYMWLIRFVVDLDAPLRRLLLGRALHARTD